MSLTLATVSASARRAFSLVEVLVAVFVLALGLLGLGAVFPAVLHQQRLATQTTQGISAQNAIAPVLANNANFRPGGRAWDAIREYVEIEESSRGDWVAIEPVDSGSTLQELGSYILDDPNDPGNPVRLPLAQRLYPLPFTTGEEPRFVWDIAARFSGDITSSNYPDDSPLLVAVFLRPIDPGIKRSFIQGSDPPVRYSLAAILLGDPSNQGNTPALKHRRHPISVDRTGVPTFDGRRIRGAEYSTPIVAQITGPGTGSGPRNILVIDAVVSLQTDKDVATILLATPGQRFLDSRGHMYTVTGINDIAGKFRTINFDPPINNNDTNGDDSFNDADFNPIIFLPTATPIEPHIFTIQPNIP